MAVKSRHLLVIDPLEKLNLAWDTTIKLAFVLSKQNVEVYCTTLDGLIYKSSPNRVFARSSLMNFKGKPSDLTLEPAKVLGFEDFKLVQMRKEPPYDLAYIEALWLLEAGALQTKIINSPASLQKINEKLVIAEFPEFARPLAVSSDPKELATFAAEVCDLDIVVKPLNLYGGRGVVHLSDPKTMIEDLRRETADGTTMRLVQKFEPKVKLGEVRAFVVGGVPLAWCLKTPDKGDFLANTRAGSILSPHVPSPREVKVVTKVAGELMKRGVYITGFDLIDGWLSEVNITCPALLAPDRESLEGFEEFARLLA